MLSKDTKSEKRATVLNNPPRAQTLLWLLTSLRVRVLAMTHQDYFICSLALPSQTSRPTMFALSYSTGFTGLLASP